MNKSIKVEKRSEKKRKDLVVLDYIHIGVTGGNMKMLAGSMFQNELIPTYHYHSNWEIKGNKKPRHLNCVI